MINDLNLSPINKILKRWRVGCFSDGWDLLELVNDIDGKFSPWNIVRAKGEM